MTALTITELEARASALDAGLALARIRIEQGAVLLKANFHLSVGKHHFKKLSRGLDDCFADLRIDQLIDLADRLDAATAHVGNLRGYDTSRLHIFGRMTYDSALSLLDEIAALSERLRSAAKLHMTTNPMLPELVYRDAIVGHAFMRSVERDPAERDPDPTYGL